MNVRDEGCDDLLEIFNNNILSVIFAEYLNLNSLSKAAQVNQHWHHVFLMTNEIWRSFYQKYFPRDYGLARQDNTSSWYFKFKSKIINYHNRHQNLDIQTKEICAAIVHHDIAYLKEHENKRFVTTETIFHLAAELGNKDICNYFYSLAEQLFAKICATGKQVDTYILYAILLHQDWTVIDAIRSKYNYQNNILGSFEGFDLCKMFKDSDFCEVPIFHLAAYAGNISVLEHFIQLDPTIVNVVHNNVTALMWSAFNGAADVVDLLLKHDGAKNMAMTNDQKMTALHLAAYYGYISVLKVLLNHNQGWLEIENSKSETPLMSAVNNNQGEVVKYLIDEQHANIYGTSNQDLIKCSAVAMTLAIQKDYQEIYNLLVARGGLNGVSLLKLFIDAVFAGHLYLVKSLHENNPLAVDIRGQVCSVALFTLVKTQQLNVLEYFLEKGADVTYTMPDSNHTDFNKSLLLVATESNNRNPQEKEAVIKLLLKHGAKLKPNEKNDLTRLSDKAQAWFELKSHIKKLKQPSRKDKFFSFFRSVTRDQELQACKKLKKIGIKEDTNITLTEADKKALTRKPLSTWQQRMR